MNRAKKLLSYTNSKHNILGVVFVLIILLVAQHPNLFSQPINSSWGKFLLLLIVILLTNYNILVGLIAAISVIGLYIYLHNSGYEGLENLVEPAKPDPSAPVASTGKTEPSTLTPNGEVKDAMVTSKFGPPPADKPKEKPVVTPSATAPTTNMVDKQLNAAEQVKSEPSRHIPVLKGKSDTVEAFSPLHGTLNASFIKNKN
jgi:hypothetical protein